MIITAFLRLSHFIGDTADLHDKGSIKPFCNGARCRACNEMNTNNFDPVAPLCTPRNTKLMSGLCQQLGDYEIEKFLESVKSKKDRQEYSQEYKARREAIYALGAKFGVIAGFNPLMDMFDRPEAAAVNNYHLALRIDYLHTLWKGMIEYACTFSLQMVLCVSKNPKFFGDKYSGVFAELDRRICRFPTKQALSPVRLNYMNSVSDVMKADALPGHRQGKGTGVMTGNTPGWMQPNIALQIMFAIGTHGQVLPNKLYECSNGKKFNPTTVVVTALSACLEVEFFSHARVISERQLTTYSSCVMNAKYRLIQLYDAKQNFLRECKMLKQLPTPLKANEYELPRYLKCHLMEHIPGQQIPDLGAEEQIFCTQGGEQAHHSIVQEAFSASSKVFSSTESEMCAYTLKREHVRRLAKKYEMNCATKAADVETTRLSFNACSNMGKVQIQRSLSGGGLMLHLSADTKQYPASEGIPLMHPLLTPGELLSQLENWSEEEESAKGRCFASKWMRAFNFPSVNGRVAELHLHGGLACTGHISEGVKPFHIRANNKYKGNFRTKRTESVFSSLEVLYEGMNETDRDAYIDFVKVFAIIELGLESTKGSVHRRFLLSVVRYKQYTGKKVLHALPYPLLKFECKDKRGGLGLDLLPLSCVHRPMFVVPSFDGPPLETASNFNEMIFHFIPFKRCVKTNNSEYAEYSVHSFGGEKVFTPLIELTSANHELGTQSKDCTGSGDESFVANTHTEVDAQTQQEAFYAFGDDSDEYDEAIEEMNLDD